MFVVRFNGCSSGSETLQNYRKYVFSAYGRSVRSCLYPPYTQDGEIGGEDVEAIAPEGGLEDDSDPDNVFHLATNCRYARSR